MPGLLLPGRHAYGYRGAPEGITSQYLGCISVVARAGLVVRAVCFQYALMMPLLQCGIVAAACPVALARHSAPAPVGLGSLGPRLKWATPRAAEVSSPVAPEGEMWVLAAQGKPMLRGSFAEASAEGRRKQLPGNVCKDTSEARGRDLGPWHRANTFRFLLDYLGRGGG